ncbi:uncharacterized protein TRIADDRAFT_59976 [Trichoplax adhaerens]|uniref:Laminin G domain-containing protein n=1 Tax=Trichoplax adhaerens TaxID=10228 RepID=B3S6Y8_TRIAD|nr:hypothetical protein TRIADDRAFT_59976 [Trichoplax adhaerens]EDV21475.1 hypothetical protein TRIADDRAFT_59976 [Trichoplax adhaerens]|eukprot:XP_002116075.1 hypothetical protein TRIADDRAFT_59976 [Trichoplax adhaerens]
MSDSRLSPRPRANTLFSNFKLKNTNKVESKNKISAFLANNNHSIALPNRRKGIILFSFLVILFFIYVFPWKAPQRIRDPEIKPHECIRAGSLVLPNKNRIRITSWRSLYYSQHSFYFRTFSRNGVMLYEADKTMQTKDFLAIQLRKRKIEFIFNAGQGTVLLTAAPGNGQWTDGQWHWINASRLGAIAELSVDGIRLVKTQLNTHHVHAVDSTSGLYVGGIPKRFYSKLHRFVIAHDFRGCIANITLNGRKWDPSEFVYSKSSTTNTNINNLSNHSSTNMDSTTLTPVVTAIDESQVHRVDKLIASVQKFLPLTEIIIYDLGLKAATKAKIRTYCNVQLVDFPISNYPRHFRNVKLEAWRSVIIKPNLQSYGSVIYVDPEVIVKRTFNKLIREANKTTSGLICRTMFEPVTAFTHPGMIKALDQSVKSYQLLPMIDTRILIFSGNNAFKLVTEWVRCTADIDCILPTGASLGSCLPRDIRPSPLYRGCHLASRSALSVVYYKTQIPQDAKNWNKMIKYAISSSDDEISLPAPKKCLAKATLKPSGKQITLDPSTPH